jgi:hypothetical protein
MPHLGAIVNQNCKKIKEKVRLKKTDLKTEVSVIVYLPLLYFNLTQPMRVATANLYKRSNKLSCILYNVCLFFDQTIWSDTTYCNGIISFLYIILGAKKPAAKAARYHLLPFFWFLVIEINRVTHVRLV